MEAEIHAPWIAFTAGAVHSAHGVGRVASEGAGSEHAAQGAHARTSRLGSVFNCAAMTVSENATLDKGHGHGSTPPLPQTGRRRTPASRQTAAVTRGTDRKRVQESVNPSLLKVSGTRRETGGKRPREQGRRLPAVCRRRSRAVRRRFNRSSTMKVSRERRGRVLRPERHVAPGLSPVSHRLATTQAFSWDKGQCDIPGA